MEDYTYINPNLLTTQDHKISVFAIFDGHGGNEVSQFLSLNIESILIKYITQSNYNIKESINKTFLELDNLLKSQNKFQKIGSTATLILIDNNIIYCANIGDTTCYYIYNNNINKLSKDHNIKNEKEIVRIKKSNGLIFNNRLYGVLNITRSFGDFDLKENGLVCIPSISRVSIDMESKYIVIASDGVWDAIKDKDLMEICKKEKKSENIAKKLIEQSLYRFSKDNVTTIVIQLYD